MTWSFRFACTQCGKCCDSSPSIFLNEIEEQADRILFRPSLRIEQVPRSEQTFSQVVAGMDVRPDPESVSKSLQAYRLRQKSYGTPIGGKLLGHKAIAYLSITDLSAGHLRQCPFRGADMSCEIHAEKPIICRSVPLPEMPRGPALKEALEKFVSKPGYECDTSESAPFLVENGRIVSEDYREARAQLSRGRLEEDLSWIPRATAASLAYYTAFTGLDHLRLVRIVASGEGGTGFAVPFGLVLFGMVDSGHVSPEEGASILSRQERACENMKSRIAAIGLLDKKAPREAQTHVIHHGEMTWSAYIERHGDLCALFREIMLRNPMKRDRMKEVSLLPELLQKMEARELLESLS